MRARLFGAFKNVRRHAAQAQGLAQLDAQKGAGGVARLARAVAQWVCARSRTMSERCGCARRRAAMPTRCHLGVTLTGFEPAGFAPRVSLVAARVRVASVHQGDSHARLQPVPARGAGHGSSDGGRGLCWGPAAAYNVFPLGPGEALKWGSNSVGTTGGVVTWSLMPDGTALDPSTAGLGMSGNSDLSSVFAQVGGRALALASIQQAFNAWSAVADIQFVQVAESGSLPFGAPYGGAPVVGSIRIGAFAIAGFTGAVGYAPPP